MTRQAGGGGQEGQPDWGVPGRHKPEGPPLPNSLVLSPGSTREDRALFPGTEARPATTALSPDQRTLCIFHSEIFTPDHASFKVYYYICTK